MINIRKLESDLWESAVLQPPECGVERSLLQDKFAAGAGFNGFVDLIAVAVAAHQLRQDHRVRMAAEHICPDRHVSTSVSWSQYSTRYLACQGISVY